MSATLYREGDDLAVLLAELDEQYPGQVRVVAVERPRVGGVLGFFARLRAGVHYELTDAPPPAPTAAVAPAPGHHVEPAVAPVRERPVASAVASAVERPVEPAPAGALQPAGYGALSELIAAAEAAEAAGAASAARAGAPPAPREPAPREPAPREPAPVEPALTEPAPANAEFAQMLLELAARKAATRVVEQPVVEQPVVEQPVVEQPVVEQPVAAPVTRAPQAAPVDSRSPLTLRRQLAELGAPIDWVPAESGDQYRVVEQLVSRLPDPPPPPMRAGQLLALVGPAAAALKAAESVRARMRVRAESIWAAGCPDGAVPAERTLADSRQAAAAAAELRGAAAVPTIVIVATDDPDGESGQDEWAAAMLRALAPDATWVLVDATRKSSDTRAALRAIGTTDALVVTGGARTASPATVWQLGAPVAMLDGRLATPGAWAILLLDKLAELTG
jgi:hypothetical protein